ncbi:MAG: tRNA 2-selenouridine(34) synthase MnmH, partial [Janthinobacterium lividum]
MKYPALITLPEALARLPSFDAVIDVRSPAEFALDHLPGAINCPVLDDEERVRVGTMYKQVNAFEAKKLGAALVARNIAHHIDTAFAGHGRHWQPLLYCWRGGNRSGAMALILAKIGWPALQLDGGYRFFRHHVNAELAVLPARFDFRVVCGTTGSGKSRLLQHLAMLGAQVLDLEALAEHRGSVLGILPGAPQPSQKMFESRIWRALSAFDPQRPVFIEAESRKVGNLRVPALLIDTMRAASCIAVSLPQSQRVALLMSDYAHFVTLPESLNKQLECLLPQHGRQVIGRWQQMALAGEMPTLVGELLSSHYDPAYLKSIERNFDR